MGRARRQVKDRRDAPMDHYECMMFLIRGRKDRPEGWRELWERNRDALMAIGAQRPGIRPWPFWEIDAGGGDLLDPHEGYFTPGDDGFRADEARRNAVWERRCRWLAENNQLRPGEAEAIAAERQRRALEAARPTPTPA